MDYSGWSKDKVQEDVLRVIRFIIGASGQQRAPQDKQGFLEWVLELPGLQAAGFAGHHAKMLATKVWKAMDASRRVINRPQPSTEPNPEPKPRLVFQSMNA
jgi:hypothetical protein